MTAKELKSYRLTSLEEPTDEQLTAIMQKVAKVAKEKSEEAHHLLFQDIHDTVQRQKKEWAEKYNLDL
ncbi:hypothetical protein [Parabacteroides sp. PF5-6]|uniref:hypothetical protein n=1 Tax=Parabacteroides sp. PF5-6 TaxID=1742403 RepID=UPI002405AB95|nr:hypothetical protein [Parabacteroides sp. PF5-6]MDF9831559.1 hypothetical protein [Parabacteroides sp. PF5-6]